MRRHLHLACALVVGVATVLVGSLAAGPTHAAAPKSTFAWTPTSLELTVERGSSIQAQVSFVSTKKLNGVAITAKEQIAGFVTPSPATLAESQAGATVLVNLAVAVPASAVLGDYQGYIDVAPAKQKAGDDALPEKKPAADTLTVTIHVVAPPAPPLPSHIYWAGASGASIGRANLDGSNATVLVSLVGGPGVAVDSEHIYWTDANQRSIGRANLDGSNPDPSFIVLPGASEHIPGDVAVDDQHIYWADSQAQTIGRANLDGSDVNLAFVSTGFGTLPLGVAVDVEHIYWTEQITGSIGRANLDGSNPNPSFMVGVGPGVGIVGVAVDTQHIYWAYNPDQFTGAIGRAALDGSNPNLTLIASATTVTGVAVDAEHIYWGNYGIGSIGRAALDGSSPNQNFITASGSPYFVAVGIG